MKNHKEMFEAFLAGETLCSPSREYKMVAGIIHSLDLSEYADGRWVELQKPPKYQSVKVKVKPKTININGVEVPEPAKSLLQGEKYWVPNLTIDDGWTTQFTFNHSYRSDTHIDMGFAHRTEEAAELHARALLSFTRPVVKP